jgi:8-oxo-dGTP diphosphatase
MQPIRVSVKAIILDNNRILMCRHRDSAGSYYILPGGGQQPGESLAAALTRECLEEIGAQVKVGSIWLVRDYIGRHHEFSQWDVDVHQVEIMFACEVQRDYDPTVGHTPDVNQTGVVWIGIEALSQHRIYPAALRDILQGGFIQASGAVYLGDVN